MSFFRGFSFKSTYPLKSIRKNSSKILKKLLGKNSAVYSINHKFHKKEAEQKSKYIVLNPETNEETKYLIMGKTEVSPSRDIEESPEKKIIDQSFNKPNNEMKNDNEIPDLKINENDYYIPKLGKIDPEKINPKKNEFKKISQNTDFMAANFDDSLEIPMINTQIIVEVQMETRNLNVDNEQEPESFSSRNAQNIVIDYGLQMIPNSNLDKSNTTSNIANDICESQSSGETAITETNSKEKESNTNHDVLKAANDKMVNTGETSEKIEMPSPIPKITWVKSQSKKWDKNSTNDASNENFPPDKIETETFGPNVVHSKNGSSGKLSFGKPNISKEYDLIEYSSINLESLMTQVDDSNSGWYQRNILENQSGNMVATPEKTAIPTEICKLSATKGGIFHQFEGKSEKTNEEKSVSHLIKTVENNLKNIDKTKSSYDKKDEIQEPSSDSRDSMTKENNFNTEEQSNFKVENVHSTYKDHCGATSSTEKNATLRSEKQTDGITTENSVEALRTTMSIEECHFDDADMGSSKNLHIQNQDNISGNSFLNLDGLVETNIDTSYDSILTESVTSLFEETERIDTEFLNDFTDRNIEEESKTGPKEHTEKPINNRSRMGSFNEITPMIEDSCKSNESTNGRIPFLMMKKFDTLFKKPSLKHLYKMMDKAHKNIKVKETPPAAPVMSKFVVNCYGPSIATNERIECLENCSFQDTMPRNSQLRGCS